ncbi:MAG: hypothetical protein D6683_12365 [Actinomyces sp.]|nr:MAG: hypothetical protein D6683_12365 [Actinomyces sp.]
MSDPDGRLVRRLDEYLGGLTRLLAEPFVMAHRVAPASRLVATTAGVFVLSPHADQVREAAVATRLGLADHLSWVPFVDGLVVVDGDGDHPGLAGLGDRRERHQRSTPPLVPVDLVPRVLTEGHAVDATTLRRIDRVLRTGALRPAWSPGLPGAGTGNGDTAPAPDTGTTVPTVDLVDGTDVTHA